MINHLTLRNKITFVVASTIWSMTFVYWIYLGHVRTQMSWDAAVEEGYDDRSPEAYYP